MCMFESELILITSVTLPRIFWSTRPQGQHTLPRAWQQRDHSSQTLGERALTEHVHVCDMPRLPSVPELHPCSSSILLPPLPYIQQIFSPVRRCLISMKQTY